MKTNKPQKRLCKKPVTDESDDGMEIYGSEDDHFHDPEIEAEVNKMLTSFMNYDAANGASLQERFERTYHQKNLEITSVASQINSLCIPENVKNAYKNLGLILKRYRSGALPKAFKQLPQIKQWVQLIGLTEPEHWTAASVFQATKVFASCAKPQIAEKFYRMILLPRARDDMEEYNKLNYHIYQSLMVATRKAQAFFKGILIPLCQSGTCTLKESTIFGSVVFKRSFPMLHAAACLMKLTQMPYNPSVCFIIRILISKRYLLPYKVLDCIFAHFTALIDQRNANVTTIWHQCLLLFVQNYGRFLSDEQLTVIKSLMKIHKHSMITPVLRLALEKAALNRPVEQMDLE